MKIAGIYPQSPGLDTKIQHAVSEPYGLEMILAIAKQQGHEVELFTNFKQEGNSVIPISEEELIGRVSEFQPDIGAFSLYTCQYPSGKRIARELKRRLPNIKNIAGNRYPTYLKSVENPFDFFVLKEGEQTFKELLNEIETTQHYERVKGLSFMKNNSVITTEQRPRNFDLDSLPDALRFPVILNQVYKGISMPPLSEKPYYAVIESSRCCYNNCKFCDNSEFWGNRIAFRSPKRVVDEMFKLKEKGVDIFYFMDLNFTAVPEKTRELCEEMLRRNLNVSWYCMSNSATINRALERDPEFLHRMKSAGCHKIAFGIESTNDTVLERMNKKVGRQFTTSNMNMNALQHSLEAGIINQGFYIIGFPWETEDSIISDSKNLRNIPLHILNIGIFTPIILSRFHKEILADGYKIDSDLEKHDRNNLVYNHRTLSQERIKELQRRIYKDFYSTQEYQQRIEASCSIDSRFRKAFDDYFKFLGGKIAA